MPSDAYFGPYAESPRSRRLTISFQLAILPRMNQLLVVTMVLVAGLLSPSLIRAQVVLTEADIPSVLVDSSAQAGDKVLDFYGNPWIVGSKEVVVGEFVTLYSQGYPIAYAGMALQLTKAALAEISSDECYGRAYSDCSGGCVTRASRNAACDWVTSTRAGEVGGSCECRVGDDGWLDSALLALGMISLLAGAYLYHNRS